MLTNRAWIYVGLGAATLTVGLVELLGAPTLRKGDRVFLLGDSLAVGLAAPLGALCRDNGLAFQSMATVGTRIDQWATSAPLAAALAAFQPTIVLISLGTNDAYMLPQPGEDIGARQAPYAAELLTMIEGVSPRAIAWIAPPTLPAAAASLQSVRRLIDSEHAITLPRVKPRVSLFPSQNLTLPRGPDGIHPVARGYAAWAGAIWQWLT
jgi:lysophospholipase L1-like esterase